MGFPSFRRMRTDWDYECAVVGGGPGGLVSALYLGRFNRKTLLAQSGKPRALWIPRSHNLLGFERGVSGQELLRKLRRQVAQVGVERWEAEVEVRPWRGGFRLISGGEEVRARKVILATGIEDVHPAIDRLQELREAGLLRYCSICDAYEYQNCPVAVIARDDSGLQKAIFIGHWTRKIWVLVPSSLSIRVRRWEEMKAVGIRVIRCDSFRLNPCRSPRGLIVEIEGRASRWVAAAYIELGAQMRDFAFNGLKRLFRTKEGYITTTQEQRTTVPGLFAVGDCVNLLGQISVAAGQGAVAATTVHNDLL